MDSLAIIGYAVRYPQEATDSARFWDLLLKARESSTAFPEDRINSKAFYHPDPDHGGTFNTKRAHFLSENPVAFDAAFFKVSKAEVLSLDPQHRLVLENTYHALENAGIPMANAISSNTSVFVNGYNHDHADNLNSDPETILKYKPIGSESSMISGRLSWFYDFRGPSLTIDTACSGSLVGLHLACQSLKTNESDMAIVSGVNVIGYLPHMVGMSYSGFLGSEGKCFAFDHRADGYARGEGVGTVIVKHLSTAIEDGDTIRAVIRGTRLNQDGRTPGITQPSLTSQERLISKTYQAAGLDTADTCFIESHGTGTQTGDYVEASAISRTFKTRRRELPLYVGALKTNIGHLEGGSGIAGLIKTILVLETGIIPPNANFEKPNPKIPIDEWNLRLPTQCEVWPTSKLRRASVSSFGLSGTNSHCILDDAYSFLHTHGISAKHNTRVGAPTQDVVHSLRKDTVDGGPGGSQDIIPRYMIPEVDSQKSANEARDTKGSTALFMLSAFDKASFAKVVSNLAAYLRIKQHLSSNDERNLLRDLSFTLSQRRTRFNWTACTLASSIPQLRNQLATDSLIPYHRREAPRLGFVFTGQGAQYAGMGQQLLAYPVFRKSLEAAERYFQTLGSEWSLMDELARDKESTRINQPAVAHPSATAIQVALVDLLASWGVSPTRVVGHSSGEVAAAYCAGKVSREAAWKIAFFRGQVTSGPITRPGSMMAVGLSPDELQPFLEEVRRDNPGGVLTIACFNSPKNQTVSGDTAMVDALKGLLDARRMFARKLNIERAYHSEHMKVFTESYQASMGLLDQGHSGDKDQSIAMYSTMTGDLIGDSSLDANHWCTAMVSPVKFEQALRALCYGPDKQPWMNSEKAMVPQIDELIEIGTHGALRSAIKETLDANDAITYQPTLDRASSGSGSLLQSIANLATKGFPVDIETVNGGGAQPDDPALLVDLPPYPFNHENKDIYESRLAKNLRLRKHPRHELFGAPVADFDPRYPKWRHFLRFQENPWLRQFRIDGRYVFPPAGYIAMVIESSMQMADSERSLNGVLMEEVTLGPLLEIPDEPQGIELSLSYFPDDLNQGRTRFQVSSYSERQGRWTQHCSAYVGLDYEKDNGSADLALDDECHSLEWAGHLSHYESHCQSLVKLDDMYNELASHGLHFGPIYQTLSSVGVSGHGEGTFVSFIGIPDISSIMPKGYMHPYLLHPVTLDNLLMPAAAAISDLEGNSDFSVFLPSFIERVWVSTKPSYDAKTQFHCLGTALKTGCDKYRGKIEAAHSSSSGCAVSFQGVHLGLYESEGRVSKAQKLPQFYSIDWKPDIHLLTNSFFDQLVPQSTSKVSNYESERERFTELQLASTLLSTDALFDLKGVELGDLEPHYLRFYDFLKHIAADILTDSTPRVPFQTWKKYNQDPHLKESLYRKVQARDSDGELLIRVGSKIASFFRKKADPLYIMFGQDDLMSEYYNSNFEIGSIPDKLAYFLDLFRWSKSNIRVLEVGGGTGSFTAHALRRLCPLGSTGRSVSEYVFTDISPSFFEKAKQSLREWGDIMTYRKFDVGSDPISQGFGSGTFDLVVASNVLHATPDLHRTLKNIHCLLKPGGKLVFQEGVRQDTLWTNLSFSPLSGWWLGTEPERRCCPYVPTTTWDRYLHESGFSGLDLEFPSSDYSEFSKISLMVSTARDEGDALNETNNVLMTVVDEGSDTLAQEVGSKMNQLGLHSSIQTLAEMEKIDASQQPCVLFMASTPTDPCTSMYKTVQDILSRSAKTLFVTGDSANDPLFELPVGLIRNRRLESESDDTNFVTVSVAEMEFPKAAIAESLARIIRHQFCSPAVPAIKNAEYRLERGAILTNRITPNIDASSTIQGRLSAPKPVEAKWSSTRPAKFVGHGRLAWEFDSLLSDDNIGDDDVEIDVSAVGLGARDLLIAKGDLSQTVLGQEASGVVINVGEAAKGIQLGDRVMCISDSQAGREGTLRSSIRVNSSLVTCIPRDLSFEAAAELPVSWLTAIYSIKYVGRLAAGEKILIHAAGSSIGQAATQYAQVLGADVFATVSDVKERDYIAREYGLQHDHIFSSRPTSFEDRVTRQVPGGMDVVISSSSGDSIRASLNCMAPFGRLIDISHGGSQWTRNAYRFSTDNVTVAKVDIDSLAGSRPAVVQAVFREIIQLLEEHKIHPQPRTTILRYSQIYNAIELLQEAASGKVILNSSDEDIVQVIPEVPAPVSLNGNASYLLIGELGPLEYRLALHMIDRGAKDLILLSSSESPDSEGTQQQVNDLQDQGCRAHLYYCNISEESELQSLVSHWHCELPPIKGILTSTSQADSANKAAATDTTINSGDEIKELLNIHHAFSSVDFIIMISFTQLAGRKSTSTFQATGTFQDALARHRVAQGLRGASLHVGDMKHDEIIAAVDHMAYHQDPASQGFYQLIGNPPTPSSYQEAQQPIPAYLSDPLFNQLPISRKEEATTRTEAQQRPSLGGSLKKVNNFEQAMAVVSREVRRKLANLLNVNGDEINETADVRTNGIDSLIEMEFRNWLDKELNVTLSTEDLDSKSLAKLSERVVGESPLVATS